MEEKIYQVLRKHNLPLKKREELVIDLLGLFDVEKELFEKELKAFIIKLRKKQHTIEEKQNFCNDHNFKLEAKAKRSEAEVVGKIINEMQNEFDLGFIWDKCLDD